MGVAYFIWYLFYLSEVEKLAVDHSNAKCKIYNLLFIVYYFQKQNKSLPFIHSIVMKEPFQARLLLTSLS